MSYIYLYSISIYIFLIYNTYRQFNYEILIAHLEYFVNDALYDGNVLDKKNLKLFFSIVKHLLFSFFLDCRTIFNSFTYGCRISTIHFTFGRIAASLQLFIYRHHCDIFYTDDHVIYHHQLSCNILSSDSNSRVALFCKI